MDGLVRQLVRPEVDSRAALVTLMDARGALYQLRVGSVPRTLTFVRDPVDAHLHGFHGVVECWGGQTALHFSEVRMLPLCRLCLVCISSTAVSCLRVVRQDNGRQVNMLAP